VLLHIKLHLLIHEAMVPFASAAMEKNSKGEGGEEKLEGLRERWRRGFGGEMGAGIGASVREADWRLARA
jgi:hypothetical protein